MSLAASRSPPGAFADLVKEFAKKPGKFKGVLHT